MGGGLTVVASPFLFKLFDFEFGNTLFDISNNVARWWDTDRVESGSDRARVEKDKVFPTIRVGKNHLYVGPNNVNKTGCSIILLGELLEVLHNSFGPRIGRLEKFSIWGGGLIFFNFHFPKNRRQNLGVMFGSSSPSLIPLKSPHEEVNPRWSDFPKLPNPFSANALEASSIPALGFFASLASHHFPKKRQPEPVQLPVV